ncbi:hypothetical protein RF11_14787 [Thelohanellus kitauei]|uniref:Sortilin C-terminal domain-containing protein n=1 Tax=Thelohanellus kitauei TaxID=669202 RepID=A0A0C2MQL0_THEKT|nr:hypothetical protein RF11_14787 [Thelohanellus kitauei]
MLGTERKSGKVWLSYDEGGVWHKKRLRATNFVAMRIRESSQNLEIAGINYNKHKNKYSLFLFNFSRVISSLYLMTDMMCQSDDYENFHVPRFNGNCFQGMEVSYSKKKLSALCFDNRTTVIPTVKSCPCSLEDFQWYNIIELSEPNYYYKDNLCVLDPFSNFTEPIKLCEEGGTPLQHLEGYELY